MDDEIAVEVGTRFYELKTQGVTQAAFCAANFDRLMTVMISLTQ